MRGSRPRGRQEGPEGVKGSWGLKGSLAVSPMTPMTLAIHYLMPAVVQVSSGKLVL